jgi:hypothetical protein
MSHHLEDVTLRRVLSNETGSRAGRSLRAALAQEPSRRAVDEMQFRARRAHDGDVSVPWLGIAGNGSQPVLHIHACLRASEKEGTVHILNMAVAGSRETTDVYVGQSTLDLHPRSAALHGRRGQCRSRSRSGRLMLQTNGQHELASFPPALSGQPGLVRVRVRRHQADLIGRDLRVKDEAAGDAPQGEIFHAGTKFDCALHSGTGSTPRTTHPRVGYRSHA